MAALTLGLGLGVPDGIYVAHGVNMRSRLVTDVNLRNPTIYFPLSSAAVSLALRAADDGCLLMPTWTSIGDEAWMEIERMCMLASFPN